MRLRCRLALGALVLTLLGPSPGSADDPGLIALGVGYFHDEPFEDDDNAQAADFRLEYRPGLTLVSVLNGRAALRPWLGGEFTSDGAAYGVGGVLIDLVIDPVVVTPSFGVGAYHDGDGVDLGSTVEFRSQVEIGYLFGDGSRVSAAYSHISNAGLSDTNPGANIISVYYVVPVAHLFGGE